MYITQNTRIYLSTFPINPSPVLKTPVDSPPQATCCEVLRSQYDVNMTSHLA